MRVEGSHSSYSVASVFCLHDLYAIVVSVAFGASFQLRKCAIGAVLRANEAIGTITFIQHKAVLTTLSTTFFRSTQAVGFCLGFGFFPNGSRVAHKEVYDAS